MSGLTQSDQRPSSADNVVPYPDQALFLGLRGADQAAVMQAIWLYEHPVDLDGIKRFHHNLYSGLLGRRIEPSPLPFGRHRWVSATRGESNFGVGDRPRPRTELFDWADEQVDLPLDPEWGPAWRLAVQPLTDGWTAVSLVVSHCIADGAGGVLACMEAINGSLRELGYPPPGSRTRRRGIREDLRQTMHDLPEIGRTIAHAARVAIRRRRDLARPGSAHSALAGRDAGGVLVPSASIFVDPGQWDARAEALGGNNFTLAAAFSGKLAQHLNRRRATDGAVTLMIPVSDRESLEHTGGNVVSIATVSFDPTQVANDLTLPRNAIRDALRKAREEPDEMIEMLPLVPFVPKRGFARIADIAFGFTTDLPVSCSNLGELPSDLLRVDGTPARHLFFRGVDRKVSRTTLDRRGGILTVASGRIDGELVMTVISYQPGSENTQSGLREVIARTLEDFRLTGTVI